MLPLLLLLNLESSFFTSTVVYRETSLYNYVCRNEDWWYAKHTDPKYNNKDEGYVPRNYVALEDTLESQE